MEYFTLLQRWLYIYCSSQLINDASGQTDTSLMYQILINQCFCLAFHIIRYRRTHQSNDSTDTDQFCSLLPEKEGTLEREIFVFQIIWLV